MNLVLEKLTIDNFKGCRHMEISFSPRITRISGRNGLGKTTIADAFFWLLINKDSAGNAPGTDDFRDKPLDENGNVVHNVETSVEAICRLDGEPFNLKRIQREIWQKTRGQAEQKFAGNESIYFINEVQMKLSEFDGRVSSVCPPGVFPYVAMMSAFNKAPWQDRRSMLVSMSGINVDEALLAREDYATLGHECATRGVKIEDLKKVLENAKRDANSEAKMIPARIDEARRSLPMFGVFEVETAEKSLETIPNDIHAIEIQIADLAVNSDAAVRQSRILALRTEITSIQNAILADHERGKRELHQEINTAKRATDEINASCEKAARRAAELQSRLTYLKKRRDALRAEYQAIYDEPFTPTEEIDVCPTCGQQTPPEYREIRLEKMRAAFQDEKRRKLQATSSDGKRVSQDIADAEEEFSSISARMDEDNEKIRNFEEHISSAEAALAAYPAAPDYESNPRYVELKTQISDLQAETADNLNDPSTKIAFLRQKILDYQGVMDRSRATLARRDSGKKTEERIAELQRQQKTVGDQIATLEKKIMLCEQFVKDRCALLEDSINSFFPSVRWKLFDQQINGGLKDCCMTMIPCGGRLVPYGSKEDSRSANTAAKLHADAEIVDVLSRHFNVSLPLFFDGRERVNELPAHSGQMITLEVSNEADLTVTEE